MQAYFRPELLNRLDEVVVFRQLERQSIRHIADLVLADTAAQLAKKNIKLKIAPDVMAKIVDEGYDQVSSSSLHGGPNLFFTLLQRVVILNLAHMLLWPCFASSCTLHNVSSVYAYLNGVGGACRRMAQGRYDGPFPMSLSQC